MNPRGLDRPAMRSGSHSLRTRLLLWMGIVHVLAAGFVAWFSCATLSNVMATAKDEQMRMLANSYSQSTRIPTMRNMDTTEIVQRGVMVIQIWSTDGRLLSSSWPALAVPLQADTGTSIVRTGPEDGDEWRVYSGPVNTPAPSASTSSSPSTSSTPTNVDGDASNANGATTPTAPSTRVQVMLSAEYLRQMVFDRAYKSVLPIALLLPLSFAVLWIVVWLSSRALRGVALDVAAQDERSLVDLSPSRVPDEIAPLVVAYNTLLGRLRQAFASQRRFVQDAAHELRTPVAAIGLQLENLRMHVPTGDAAERFAQLESGVTRSQHLIEQLLKLSHQDNAAAPSSEGGPANAPIDIAGLLRESVGQLMVVADRRRVDIGFEGRIDAAVRAPVADLRSVFDNLIGNALRHVPEGGVVDVVLRPGDGGDEGHAVVDVIDNGPGIDDAFIDRAFDRFFRVPGTAAGGSGLGLSIARMAAERSGMRIELLNRKSPDADRYPAGLIARVHLPGRWKAEEKRASMRWRRRARVVGGGSTPAPSPMPTPGSGIAYRMRRRQAGKIGAGLAGSGKR